MDRVVALKETFSRSTAVPSSSSHISQSGHIKETVDVDVLPPPTPEWRETCITIKEKLYYSLLNGSFSDVKFVVGQHRKKEILAHKYILLLNSSIFQSLLEGTQMNKTVTITVSDVEPDAFMSFLKFIYTDDFEVHVRDATAVLYLAKKYDVSRLIILSADFIKSNISTKNVVSVLLSADALGEVSISAQARQFLRRNISYVIHEEDFLQLNAEELCQIFGSDELVVSELELFNATLHWASEECKRQKLEQTPQNYRHAMKDVLPLIRFPLMDRKEFTFHVATKNILTDSECLNVLMHADATAKERSTLPTLLFSNRPRKVPKESNIRHQEAFVSMPRTPVQTEYFEGYYYDPKIPEQNFATTSSKRGAPPPPKRTVSSSQQHHILPTSSNPVSQWDQQVTQQPFTYMATAPNLPQTYLTSGFLDYGR
ncbi:unnamed protein product [Orchesella dallaii]